jgi:hypothetical protein
MAHLSFYRAPQRAFARMSSVIELLFRSRPSTVSRFVISVVVGKAVQCFATRTFTHIGQEIVEIHPSFANIYSAPTVIFRTRMIQIEAALFHRSPTSVGARSDRAMPTPMMIENKSTGATSVHFGRPATSATT